MEALVRQFTLDLVCSMRKQRGLRIGLLNILHQGHAFFDDDVAVLEGWRLAARVDRQNFV